MKTYLLTAAGVIFLSVIVSLIMPEGKLYKSITFIMRLICIVVLIQPLTGIFKNFTGSEQSSELFDSAYVCGVYSSHQSVELEKLLEKEFNCDLGCEVSVDYAEGEFTVSDVKVILSEKNDKLIEEIYSYLDGLGYKIVTVYAQST